jgi:hypothetical protein
VRPGAVHATGASGPNRVRGRTASTRAQWGEHCGRLRRRTARRPEDQLAGIEAPVAADSPCARNPAGGSRPSECLWMDAEAPCRLARGKEMVLRRALAKQRTKFLTCAWIRAQLIENRQDQCVRHARLSPRPLGRSLAVVLPLGVEVCCGRHVVGEPGYAGESSVEPVGAQLEAEAFVVSIIVLGFRASARVASAGPHAACGAGAGRR